MIKILFFCSLFMISTAICNDNKIVEKILNEQSIELMNDFDKLGVWENYKTNLVVANTIALKFLKTRFEQELKKGTLKNTDIWEIWDSLMEKKEQEQIKKMGLEESLYNKPIIISEELAEKKEHFGKYRQKPLHEKVMKKEHLKKIAEKKEYFKNK